MLQHIYQKLWLYSVFVTGISAVATMPTVLISSSSSPILGSSVASYNVNRFVPSSLFCVRLNLKSYIAMFFIF